MGRCYPCPSHPKTLTLVLKIAHPGGEKSHLLDVSRPLAAGIMTTGGGGGGSGDGGRERTTPLPATGEW